MRRLASRKSRSRSPRPHRRCCVASPKHSCDNSRTRVVRYAFIARRRSKIHQPKKNQREEEETMSNREDYQLPPKEGFVLTHFLTVADVNRSAEFYVRILGGTVVRSGEPTIIQIANSWLIVNVGGGPTDDKPTVTLRPPVNPNEVSSFL